MLSVSSILSPAVLLAAAHHRFFNYRFDWTAQPVLALIAGLLILIRPKLLNFIVAAYLIVIGIIGLFHLSVG